MPLLLLGAASMISMHFYGGNRWTGTCYLIWISNGLHWKFLDERWNEMFLLSSEALWFLVCGLQRSLLFWFVCGWQAAPTSTAWLINWCAKDHSQVACGSAPGTNAPVKVGIVFINVSWVANSCWEVRSAIDWLQMIFDLFCLFYCVPHTFMETKRILFRFHFRVLLTSKHWEVFELLKWGPFHVGAGAIGLCLSDKWWQWVCWDK